VKDLAGRVAVVTGAGSGIGRGIAHALADAGMHVVVADVEADTASTVAGELDGGTAASTLAVEVDVTERGAMQSLAERIEGEVGPAAVLCNNAGVAVFGPLIDMDGADWDWLLAVNVGGVVNGLLAFLPGMRDRGEGHVVNTASMGGLLAGPDLGVYSTTKFAVVAISEALRQEAAGFGVGVSVLCPGLVRTRLGASGRNRPAGLATGHDALGWLADAIDSDGMDPLDVGRAVRDAIEADRLYVLTHPEYRPLVEARGQEILAAFDEQSG